jgi:hypothetical protein
MTWNYIYADNFARADGLVGNGWSTTNGGAPFVIKAQMANLPMSTDPSGATVVLRPPSESFVDQSMLIQIENMNYKTGCQLVLRYQDASDFYMLVVYLSTTTTLNYTLYKVVSGSITALQSGTFANFPLGHTINVGFTATGTNPTSLNCVAADVTAGGTSIFGFTVNDSSATPLQQAGRFALRSDSVIPPLKNCSAVNCSNDVALPASSALTAFGPGSGALWVSSVFTVTLVPDPSGVSSAVVVTPHSSAAAAFTPPTATIQVPSAGPVQASFVRSGTGLNVSDSITFTNNGGLTNPAALTYVEGGPVPSWQTDVSDFGARGDAKVVADAAMTAGTATLTSASAIFTSADVGKTVVVNGAGASAPLFTTITQLINPTTVTTAGNASTTVSNAVATYGTENTGAFQKALNWASANKGGLVVARAGGYLFTGHINIPDSVTLQGTYFAPTAHPAGNGGEGFGPTAAFPGQPGPLDNGTTFLLTEQTGGASGTAFCNVNNDSCLRGVVLYWPNQLATFPPGVTAPVAYPYAIQMNALNPAVQDIEVINAYGIINAVHTKRHIIRNVFGQVLAVGIRFRDAATLGALRMSITTPFGISTLLGRILLAPPRGRTIMPLVSRSSAQMNNS